MRITALAARHLRHHAPPQLVDAPGTWRLLGVVRYVTDQVVVMRRGRIVERGPTARVLAGPRHPYTALLLDSLPRPGWDPHRIAELRRALAAPGP